MLENQQPSGLKLEAWETSAPEPSVTIRSGGPLDGVVTITPTGASGRVGEATWGSRYARRSASVERVGNASADELAHAWVDELAAGRVPAAD